MVKWNSSPHPISDIRDWSESGRLELRPDFQRLEVWSLAARIMLMDTILRNIPMPKIFLANTIRDSKTYRVVIDGQQRIAAILAFLRDDFSLDAPYASDEKGKKFSELTQKTKDRFLSYQIDFNEAQKPTTDEVREVYARVNKYTVPLNKQELRRADFPGDFLDMSEEFAIHGYLDRAGIFSAANRRRYGDVEYVSELLAAMIDGIQDKKTTLDDFYTRYSTWNEKHKREISDRFSNVLKELQYIFNKSFNIAKTRFRQKADFYTMFLAIDKLISDGQTVIKKEIEPLREDLRILQANIRPESDIRICSDYAIKCVSQGNTASSRRWRHNFLKAILAGTYIGGKLDIDTARVFYGLKDHLSADASMGLCLVCQEEMSGDFSDRVLAWPHSNASRQLSNAGWAHRSCIADQTDLVHLDRPKSE